MTGLLSPSPIIPAKAGISVLDQNIFRRIDNFFNSVYAGIHMKIDFFERAIFR